MRFIRTLIAAVGIYWAVHGAAAADEFAKAGGIRIFSDFTYTSSEGEFSGNQIIIIPSTDGDKVLWRTADGQFNAPLLLDAVRQGDLLKIKVPDAGEWTLRVRGTVLEATSSRGVKLRLNRSPLK